MKTPQPFGCGVFRQKHPRLHFLFLIPLVIADFDEPAAEAYGKVRAPLEAQGKPIRALDILTMRRGGQGMARPQPIAPHTCARGKTADFLERSAVSHQLSSRSVGKKGRQMQEPAYLTDHERVSYKAGAVEAPFSPKTWSKKRSRSRPSCHKRCLVTESILCRWGSVRNRVASTGPRSLRRASIARRIISSSWR